jgi:hypothetical protein
VGNGVFCPFFFPVCFPFTRPCITPLYVLHSSLQGEYRQFHPLPGQARTFRMDQTLGPIKAAGEGARAAFWLYSAAGLVSDAGAQ